MTLAFDPIEESRRNWRRRGRSQPVPGMTSVLRAAEIMRTEVTRALRPLKITYPRVEVLSLLSFSRAGAMPLGKISERLQVHPTSVTVTVDRLERDGLVRRLRQPDDRRTVLAEITDEGRKLVRLAEDVLREGEFSIRALDPEELEQLMSLLRKMRLEAGDFDPEGEAEHAARAEDELAGKPS